MNVVKHPKIEIANVTLQESTFTNDEKFGNICEVLSILYCDQSTTEIAKSQSDSLIHELSQPMAKIFAPKYKMGQKVGKLLKADLESTLNNVSALGFDEKRLPKIVKAINKFQRVAGGEDVSEDDEETDTETKSKKKTVVTAEPVKKPVDPDASEDELDISSYLEKAKDIYQKGSEIKNGILLLLKGIGEKLKESSGTIATDNLIEEAGIALTTLEELDIDLFLKNRREWEGSIPGSALSQAELASELKKLNTLCIELTIQQKPRMQLIENCCLLKNVQIPTKMKVTPITDNPISRFGAIFDNLGL